MAVVVYKCTVCNREVDLVERPDGLERINRCVITNDCRGTLYKVQRKQDFAVGRAPQDVAGVTNYIQRRVLYNHVQAIAEDLWLVVHNLGVNPSVQVVVDRDETVDGEVVAIQVEVEPEEVVIINENTVTVRFARPESGLAQCIARSAAPSELRQQQLATLAAAAAEPTTYFQLSNDGFLTIATDDTLAGSPLLPIRIYFFQDEELSEAALLSADYIDYDAVSPANAASPWNDATEVFVNGRRFTVRTIEIGDPVTDLGIPNGVTVAFKVEPSDHFIILLGRAPYGNVDKIRNRIFRPSWNEGPTKTLETFIFGDGEFLVDETAIEQVFPPVHLID